MAFWHPPRMPKERKKRPVNTGRKPPQQKPRVQRWVEDLNPNYVFGMIAAGILIGFLVVSSLDNSEEWYQAQETGQVAAELLTPTSTPTPVYKFEPEMETEMADEVNHERSTRALEPLKLDDQLSYIARIRSSDMAVKNYFNHIPPDGCNYICLIDSAGIVRAWVGENIAWNQMPLSLATKDAMKLLMESPEHRDAILNCHYQRIGIGIAERNDGVIYYTQIFEGGRDC